MGISEWQQIEFFGKRTGVLVLFGEPSVPNAMNASGSIRPNAEARILALWPQLQSIRHVAIAFKSINTLLPSIRNRL